MPYYPVLKLSKRQTEYVKEFNNNPKIKFEKISCYNCSSINQKILFRNDRYGFNQKTVLCKNCGLIYSNPRMTEDTTDFFYKSDLYRNVYEEGGITEFVKFINQNRELVEKFIEVTDAANENYKKANEISI